MLFQVIRKIETGHQTTHMEITTLQELAALVDSERQKGKHTTVSFQKDNTNIPFAFDGILRIN